MCPRYGKRQVNLIFEPPPEGRPLSRRALQGVHALTGLGRGGNLSEVDNVGEIVAKHDWP